MLINWPIEIEKNKISKQKFQGSEQIVDFICGEFSKGEDNTKILIPEVIRHNMLDALTTQNGKWNVMNLNGYYLH